MFRLRTVEALAKAAEATAAGSAAAEDADASGELPLSPLQEGLLFHLMLAGEGRDVYVQQAVVELSGPVDPARMGDAVRTVLRKFLNLRAGFRTDGDRAVQFVPDDFEPPWTHARVSGEDELEAFVDAQRAEPFDPSAPPLIRFGLASLADGDHRLVLTSELILLDGWSGGLLVTSLLDAYTDAAAEAARPVPSFRAFLDWVNGRDRDAAVDAWRARCPGSTNRRSSVPAWSTPPPTSPPPRRCTATCPPGSPTASPPSPATTASPPAPCSRPRGAWCSWP
ncbi:hypothetical protein BJF79_44595 [Actinomadura sp. CNU-125]|nr:hypothetical protein BJF79_44595 [Actinomadura sp. CNU-125]